MAKSPSGFKNSQRRCPFLHILPPHQTTGSPVKLFQQRLISGTSHCVPSPPHPHSLPTPTHFPPPHTLTSLPHAQARGAEGKDLGLPPHFLGRLSMSPLQVGISIFISATTISQLFTEANRDKNGQHKNSCSAAFWGVRRVGAQQTLPIFFLLSFSKRKNARIVHLFQTDPQQFQTAHSGAP